jgi:hypothetical protein
MSAATNPPTRYKTVKSWEVDNYMTALENYNRPFKTLARRVGNEFVVPTPENIPTYNPPMPIWIERGSQDNVFVYELNAYKAQLEALAKRTGNMARPGVNMVEIINRPPVPRRPPPSVIVNGAPVKVVQNAPVEPPSPAPVVANPPPIPSRETIPDYNKRLYDELYAKGKTMFLSLFPSDKYESSVAFEPPNSSDNNFEVQEKFFELYDHLRQIWADNMGDEAFFIQFPRFKTVAEGFKMRTKEGFLANRTCAPVNPNQSWLYNYSTARDADREQMKIEFCAGLPDYSYIAGDDPDCPTNCYSAPMENGNSTPPGLGKTSTNVDNIGNTMADGRTQNTTIPPPTYPPTYIGNDTTQIQTDTKKYKYSWYNFDKNGDIEAEGGYSASFNKDSYAVKMSKTDQFKFEDIQEYYKMLTSYNTFWLYKYGWRDQSNRDRPYNPPIPIWLDPEDEPADKEYMQTLTTYNDFVKNKLRQYMENSPTVRLPDDFKPLPEPPAYPSLLKDLLTNPQKYADKQQGGSEIPVAKPGVSYTLPTIHLLSMLQAARDKLQASIPTSSSSAVGGPLPKCPGGPCKKYSDYVPDFVKKHFEDQAAKTQQKKVQNGFLDYAFSRPGPR